MHNAQKWDLEKTTLLVLSAKEGDLQARESLFERYLPRVRQIVALRMGQRLRQFLEVEDIVQESLIKVLLALDRFQPGSEGSFHNWVARCVECEIIDRARGAARRKSPGGRDVSLNDSGVGFLTDSVLAGHEPRPSEVARAHELQEKIEQKLLAMPKHLRELVIMRNLCGMPYSEIARNLGLASETAVRMALSRTLRKLKHELGI